MKKLTLIPAVLMLFAQCKQSNSQNNSSTDKKMTNPETPINKSNTVDGNNQFATDLLKKYTNNEEQKNRNIFFSPVSIYTALAMTNEGANGKTIEEINNTVHVPADKAIRHTEMQNLITALNPNSTNYKLTIANAVWAQKEYPFVAAYLNTCKTVYNAQAQNLDFITHPAEATKTINNWVESNTNNKIKDIISEKNITKNTRMILTNAIYFKAEWNKPFEKEYTSEKDFYTTTNGISKVQMMQMQRGFPYSENEKAQVLEIPYKGDELSMVIILPKQRNTIQTITNSTNLASFAATNNNWSQVRVLLPKFKFSTKYLMKDDLTQMGMPTPFSDKADFSGISATKELQIGQVIHQTFIEVNEDGTEAAAATVVDMEAGSAPREPITFNANHPFIFLIKHNKTNTILFTGVVNNPNE